jgi:hypothetical protein
MWGARRLLGIMACGTEDDTLNGQHQFADLLRKRHIAYEAMKFPGRARVDILGSGAPADAAPTGATHAGHCRRRPAVKVPAAPTRN